MRVFPSAFSALSAVNNWAIVLRRLRRLRGERNRRQFGLLQPLVEVLQILVLQFVPTSQEFAERLGRSLRGGDGLRGRRHVGFLEQIHHGSEIAAQTSQSRRRVPHGNWATTATRRAAPR